MQPEPQQPTNRRYHQNLYHQSLLFKKGQKIFSEGDERTGAFIIEHGEVEISTQKGGKDIPLVRLGEGEIFGEMAIFERGKRTATATALQDTHTFVISPQLMQQRLGELDPLVGLFLNILINRYRQARFRSADEVADGVGDQEMPKSPKDSPGFMNDWLKQKEKALGDLRVAQEIAQAIEQRQFIPYLQPILRLKDRTLLGFEALIRWQHPQRGIVSPAEFIAVAERTNMVKDLDMQMLYQACMLAPRLQERFRKTGIKPFISVNLSGLYFVDEKLVDEIAAILERTKVDTSFIKLEITESALVGTGGVAEGILKRLKAMGLGIALDDFGTGYSSLSYLHRFAIDTIKIDRSFVLAMRTERKSLDIIRAIVGLARTFDLDIVAEGIENEDEIQTLYNLGCDWGQGYFFSKPLAVDAALAFMDKSISEHEK